MNTTRSITRSKPLRGAAERPRTNGSGGSAQRSYDRYITLAREAASAGDVVEMENYYQHAEHFFRTMAQLTTLSD
jgi:hypothetical protein